MLEFNKQKMNKLEAVQCLKNDVGVCLIHNLVNLVKAFYAQCSCLFVQSQNSGVQVGSSIDEHIWVHSFNKMVLDPLLTYSTFVTFYSCVGLAHCKICSYGVYLKGVLYKICV